MNYIELINNFWKADIEYSFTGNETKLYMFLLHTSNSLGWKNPFRLSYRQIELGSNLTVNTIVSARNKLSQVGLISFEVGKRGNAKNINNKAIYTLRLSKIDNQTDNHTGNQTDNHTGNQTDNQTDNINKLETINLNNNTPLVVSLENTKSKSLKAEKEKSSAKKEKEYDLSFAPSDNWQTLIREWLEYKAERKESYKSEKTIKAFFTQLWNLSLQDIATAQVILQQSYACNYAGIFPLKSNSYANTTNSCNRKTPNLHQSDFD